MEGNFAAKFLKILDCVGANGRADRYKCGVLCKMAALKVRTKCWVSITASLR
jgi:hypothetical protein